MKILHIIEQLGIGGAEKDLIDKSLLLLQKQIDITVYCFCNKGILADELEQHHARIISEPHQSKLSAILRGSFHLKNLLHSVKPDIIHTHLYSGEALMTLFTMLHSTRIPCISSVQSLTAQMRTRSKPARKFIDHFVKKHYSRFIACSQAVKQELIRREFPPSIIEVIYNGVNFVHNNSALPGDIPGKQPIIGVISRLSPYKGIEYFIKAVPKVLQQFPGCRFWIIGDGAEKYVLLQLIQALNLSSSILMLGAQKYIQDYLTQLSILVVPSLCEPLGITALEGLANHIPVIATAVDGLKEIIIDSKTGFLVEPASPEAIADKIIYILANYGKAHAIAHEGFLFGRENFSLEKVAQQQYLLYQSLLQ
jgi:glycosyltransferase involved in cell wall biosynthesis